MRRSLFLWRLDFFGLTPEYRLLLFKTLHEIAYHGKGGYPYETVYDMPIWLRRATFNFINQSITAENEANEKSAGGSSSNSTNLDWANPNKNLIPNSNKSTTPLYNSKAAKK